MLTSVWGPSLWHFLHIMSFNYPVKPTMTEKKSYYYFIINLQSILPCKYCRENLTKNFLSHPLKMYHLKNRNTFSKYVYDLHEIVNKMLKKKSGLTYKQVRTRYEHFRARCTKRDYKKKLFKFKKTQKEKGCVEPFYGNKSKCIIKIVPENKKCETFQMDNKCIRKKIK